MLFEYVWVNLFYDEYKHKLNVDKHTDKNIFDETGAKQKW